MERERVENNVNVKFHSCISPTTNYINKKKKKKNSLPLSLPLPLCCWLVVVGMMMCSNKHINKHTPKLLENICKHTASRSNNSNKAFGGFVCLPRVFFGCCIFISIFLFVHAAQSLFAERQQQNSSTIKTVPFHK